MLGEEKDVNARAEGVGVKRAGFCRVGGDVDMAPVAGACDFPRKESFVKVWVLDDVRTGCEAG
jgi:hypothetical protein